MIPRDASQGIVDAMARIERERNVMIDNLKAAEPDRILAVVEAATRAVNDLTRTFPSIRDAKPGWFHDSTLDLVAAVDALPKSLWKGARDAQG